MKCVKFISDNNSHCDKQHIHVKGEPTSLKMRAQFSSLFIFSLVIVKNVCTTHSTCYLDQRISNGVKNHHSKFKDCLDFRNVSCDDGLFNPHSESRLLDISENEEGLEKLKLSSTQLNTDPKLLLNVSMNNIQLEKLTVRLRSRKPLGSYPTTCHTIDFGITQNINLFGLFSPPSMWDGIIEFFVQSDGINYFRNYTFKMQNENILDDSDITKNNKMFTYVDISVPNTGRLYIEPLNESYNVTQYSGKLACNEKANEPLFFNISEKKLYHDWEYHPEKTLDCHFEIQPFTDECINKDKCYTVGAHFEISGSSHRMIIMIVSGIILPFAVFIVLHQAYVWYINRVRSKRNPYCLLIHPGSPKVHVDVMVKLAKYLRSCKINAMIDVLDVSKHSLNNPNLWCQEAFEKATTVIISGSPPNIDNSVPMYRIYPFAMKLVHANSLSNEKDFITLKFPYCKRRDDIPSDARLFKVINISKDLDKLVKKICGYDEPEPYKKSPLRDELLKSIKAAEKIIRNAKSERKSKFFSEIRLVDNSSLEVKKPMDGIIIKGTRKTSDDESVCSFGSDLESLSDEAIWGRKTEEDDEEEEEEDEEEEEEDEEEEEEEMFEDKYNSDVFFSRDQYFHQVP